MKRFSIFWLLFVWTDADAKSVFDIMSPECQPSFPKYHNFSDPFTLQEVKRAAIKSAWARPLFLRETPLLKRLQNIILEMGNSNSIYFTDLAFVYTCWGSGVFSNLEDLYPSFCSIARAINKTVEWHESGNNATFIESLQAAHNAVAITMSGIKYATMKELGCKNITEPIVDVRGCWFNGFTADVEGLWNIFGTLIPWPLREIINELMDSYDFTERAAAAIFNFVLTPPAEYFWQTTDPALILLSSNLFSQAANKSISKCCCGEWNSKIDNFTAKVQYLANNAVEVKIQEIKNAC